MLSSLPVSEIKLDASDIRRFLELTPSEYSAPQSLIGKWLRDPKKKRIGKKHRSIYCPTKEGKWRLTKLHKLLSGRKLHHHAAHGSISGKSPFSCARVHFLQDHIFKLDIENCFPSSKLKIVQLGLRERGLSEETTRLLSALGTIDNHIPQGSPASTDILNIAFWHIDQDIDNYCSLRGVFYTRFVDDFTISGSSLRKCKDCADYTKRRIECLDYNVKFKGISDEGLIPKHLEQVVHSIGVGSRLGLAVNKSMRHDIVEMCGSYIGTCKSLQPSSIVNAAKKRARLVGMLNYVRQFDDGPDVLLESALRQGDDQVLKHLIHAGIVGASTHRNMPHNQNWWYYNKKTSNPSDLADRWSSKSREAAQLVS